MSMPVGTIRKTHCKRGHERTPDNVHKNGMCKTCQKEKLARYNKEHPEKQRVIQKRWRDNNPEKARGKVAKWREANREKERESARLSYRTNIEKMKAKGAKYRLTSQSQIKANLSRWKSDNKDRVLDLNRQRRARLLGATVEKFRSSEIYERDGWVCGICGCVVDHTRSYPDPFSVGLDHIVPLSKGGHHSKANCQTAHLRCNMVKSDRMEAMA